MSPEAHSLVGGRGDGARVDWSHGCVRQRPTQGGQGRQGVGLPGGLFLVFGFLTPLREQDAGDRALGFHCSTQVGLRDRRTYRKRGQLGQCRPSLSDSTPMSSSCVGGCSGLWHEPCAQRHAAHGVTQGHGRRGLWDAARADRSCGVHTSACAQQPMLYLHPNQTAGAHT